MMIFSGNMIEAMANALRHVKRKPKTEDSWFQLEELIDWLDELQPGEQIIFYREH